MTKHFECPTGDESQCQLEASLELLADGGVVQQNCRACGAGCSIRVTSSQAEGLHQEMHRHREPPKAAAAAEPADRSPGNDRPTKPLGRVDP